MTLSNNDLTTFFHMRNHYLKLKKAKSTFVCPPSKARAKSSCSLLEIKRREMMDFEEKHFKKQFQHPFDDGIRPSSVTCLYHSDSNENVQYDRPSTRRNPNDSPASQQQVKPRSLSLSDKRIFNLNTEKIKKCNTKKYISDLESKGTTSTLCSEQSCSSRNKKTNNSVSNSGKSSKCELSGRSEPIKQEKTSEDYVKSPSRTSSRKKTVGDHKSTKVEEHEYLQFLLRVTEDIILNEYYSNEDIERVFKDHMEINKYRLIKEKMEQYLAKLADELNMSNFQNNFQGENCTQLLKSHPSYTNIQALKTIENGISSVCTEYLYSPKESSFYSKNYQHNLDEIIYYRHSLGRVTECTEPSNSSLSKVLSSCPTKSDIAIMEVEENTVHKLKNTDSESLNLERSETKVSLRDAVSKNFKYQKIFMDNSTEEKSPSKDISKHNNNQNISIEEDSNSYDEKDFDMEKFKNFKSSSEMSQNMSKSGFIKSAPNTANEDLFEDDDNKFDAERNQTGQKKRFKNDIDTENIVSFERVEKQTTNNEEENVKINITSKLAATDAVEGIFMSTDNDKINPNGNLEKFELNKEKKNNFSYGGHWVRTGGHSSDITVNGSDFNSNKNMAKSNGNEEKRDIGTEKRATNEFNSVQFNKYSEISPTAADFNFAKDSLDCFNAGPYPLNTESLETLDVNIPLKSAKPETSLKRDCRDVGIQKSVSSKPKEIDKSVQTSCHKLYAEEKPQMENKCTQMSCSSSNKACSTEDVLLSQGDYVLITSPVYVLKSVINSYSKTILTDKEFIKSEGVGHGDVENQSDHESELNTLDRKLLGPDYDLTPERDTTGKYQSFAPDVTHSATHTQFPSSSSSLRVQGECLLLGNLYDLNEDYNQELDLGSTTYRCKDNSSVISCDEDIFLRHSEVIFSRNWLSDKTDEQRSIHKKRVSKLKHVRANVDIGSSTSSASLTF